MDISPRLAPGRLVVEGYGRGGFRVAGRRYDGAILIVGETVSPWPVAAPGDADLGNLAPVLAAAPAVELVLFGCGVRAASVNAGLRADLARRGVAIEPMDNRSGVPHLQRPRGRGPSRRRRTVAGDVRGGISRRPAC